MSSSTFQSAPDAEAGRNRHRTGGPRTMPVSICSRRRGREKPGDRGVGQAVGLVSIRSRRRGREKPFPFLSPAQAEEFQSAPDAEAGRNP